MFKELVNADIDEKDALEIVKSQVIDLKELLGGLTKLLESKRFELER